MDFSDLTKQGKLNDFGITYFRRLRVLYVELDDMAIYQLRHSLGCHPAHDSLSDLLPNYHLC